MKRTKKQWSIMKSTLSEHFIILSEINNDLLNNFNAESICFSKLIVYFDMFSLNCMLAALLFRTGKLVNYTALVLV